MTHPFHPLAGRDFEFVEHRQNWGEDRVCLHDEDGQLFSLPAGWTDAAAADPFVVMAAGRCPFTTDGLLALADLADRLRAQRDGTGAVKRSSARIPCAWDRRNSGQPGPSRRGAGLIPALLRIFQTVDGATVMPSPASSPWMRRYPHDSFSRASRSTTDRTLR